MDRNWYELSEYTGLKDKNGKEIFEDDIVCFRYTDWVAPPATRDHELVGRIVFDRYKWNLASAEKYTPFDDLFHDKFEVIGNIYENPELLANPKTV